MIILTLGAVALIVAAMPHAYAQGGGKGVPNALQGFSQNREQPVKIEASSLEVRDKQKMATFSGNVKVVQGDTTMRCKSLVVIYEGGAQAGGGQAAGGGGTPMMAASPGPGGKQQISRLEAKGGVVVTQKDQTATGDTGLFDMKSNTVTLSGNVVVSQGQNVMRGNRLVVDLTTGVSRVDAGSQGPVRMLIQQQPQGQSQTQPQGQPQSQPQTPRLLPSRPFSSN